MLKNSLYARIVTGAAGVSLLLQSMPVSAAPQAAQQVSLGTDVALEDGNLTGKVLTSNGKPVDGAVVSILKDGKEVGKTVTKADGSYTIGGLTTGSYTLVTAEGPVAVRLWSKSAAPASAKTQLTVSQNAVRGEGEGFGGGGFEGGGYGGYGGGLGGMSMGNWGTVLGIGAVTVLGGIAISQNQQIGDLQDEIDQLQSP